MQVAVATLITTFSRSRSLSQAPRESQNLLILGAIILGCCVLAMIIAIAWERWR